MKYRIVTTTRINIMSIGVGDSKYAVQCKVPYIHWSDYV